MKITCSKTAPPLGGILLAAHIKSTLSTPITIIWGTDNSFEDTNGAQTVFRTSNDLARALAKTANESDLKGSNALEKTEVDSWLTFSTGPLTVKSEFSSALQYLNAGLQSATYLVGNRITIADFAVFAALYVNKQWQGLISKKEAPAKVQQWYNSFKSLPQVNNGFNTIPDEVRASLSTPTTGRQSMEKTTAGRQQEGKFIELPEAEMGKVVVRFPPEASGYLHIGHAKAALLNQYYQQAFEGQLIMRFDDTNPAKENVHFEKVILEDLEMLEIKPDRFTHTSQYFDLMLEYCEKMLKDGTAYVDDTDAENMKLQRDERAESTNRNNAYEKNLKMWKEMKAGSESGQKCCVRAKIDMQSNNGCMRDPTIYRCKNEAHPRTGNTYKVYPTYDFACPIVDAIEGVTHTLRTMEYHDRDPQFYWFIEALNLRRPYIWEYSRLSMTNTVLSKRKLTWFVQEGLVDGWDDARMPTVRGVLRRGMTVEGLKQFIIAQGSSRSVVFMEWDKIWAFNKKVIDPIAPRYTALNFNSPVLVKVSGVKTEKLSVAKHPKNSEVGNKDVWISESVLIDMADAVLLKENENATFINWGNLRIKKINKENGVITSIEAEPNLEDKDYKKTLKLTWLATVEKEKDARFASTYCVYFDHIISKALLGKEEDFKEFVAKDTRKEVKMLGDPELRKLKKGDIIQLQRIGFFKVDVAFAPANEHTCREQPVVLFYIPDGHTKESPFANVTAVGKTTEKVQKSTKTATAAPKTTLTNSATDINSAIVKQGDLVRSLKEKKAIKAEIEIAVKTLLALKADYKTATGTDWKPGCVVETKAAETAAPSPGSGVDINAAIVKQGDLVRTLKEKKATKAEIDPAVKALLALKADYKAATGTDWKPGCVVETKAAETAAPSAGSGVDINAAIVKQGDLVRSLKEKKATKAEIEVAVKALLALKGDYKTATGSDWKPGCVVETKAVEKAALSAGSGVDINAAIVKQGDLVRSLKEKKATKAEIEVAVKALLALKGDYKTATGSDWKPGCVVETKAVETAAPSAGSGVDINAAIVKQGDLVRILKGQKAAKGEIEVAVKALLALKADYKAATGSDWKPGCVVETAAPAPSISDVSSGSEDIDRQITAQGDIIRILKSEKASKDKLDPEIKKLLALKADYKNITGKDWKPNATPAKTNVAKSTPENIVDNNQFEQKENSPEKVATMEDSPRNSLLTRIAAQGDAVRILKSQKADNVDGAVKVLLALKAEFKTLTGTDWKPDMKPSKTDITTKKDDSPPSKTSTDSIGDELTAKVNSQGDLVRTLKGNKAPKEDVDAAVKALLELKAQYKTATGHDFPTAGKSQSKDKPPKDKVAKAPKPAKPATVTKPADDSGKKQTRLGLEARKEESLSEWYSQVITKGEMIEYYDVSGCYIYRPWSYAIWEVIKEWFDGEIKKMGVQNCYFPMFVSKAVLEKEKTHIADFAPEVAWVTKSGDSDMAEPIAVRPTSETVMYPAYAKWIQSYRDLPIKLNQWNNVVRWEFKHPQPFLRTREFLWQEGHTAYADQPPAELEVRAILELYARVYTDLLAIPVVRGRKTEKEKFAGGDYTLTVEAFVSASGRAIQGATSHHLGQNFSRMFDIVYESPESQEKVHVWQNSWGITTRTIGVMIMVHADNQGLVLPPKVASVQTVIVPCGVTVNLSETDKNELQNNCTKLEDDLVKAGVRAKGDYRDNYSPGWKFNHWELKGVPIRIELGPKDVKNNQIVAVRRDTGEKITIKRENAVKEIVDLLENIQTNLYNNALNDLNSHKITLTDWSQFGPNLDKKNIILSPFCGEESCEDKIKTDSARDDGENIEPGAPSMGAKSLCIPLEQPIAITAKDKCIHPDCKRKPKFYTLFGRSY